MNRATPAQLRKCIEAANAMVKARIRFVPIPVMDDEDHEKLTAQMVESFEKIEAEAER